MKFQVVKILFCRENLLNHVLNSSCFVQYCNDLVLLFLSSCKSVNKYLLCTFYVSSTVLGSVEFCHTQRIQRSTQSLWRFLGQWSKFSSFWYSISLKNPCYFLRETKFTNSFYVSQFHTHKCQFGLPIFCSFCMGWTPQLHSNSLCFHVKIITRNDYQDLRMKLDLILSVPTLKAWH